LFNPTLQPEPTVSRSSEAEFFVKFVDQKNKCGLGQPPKPHCYRGRSACRLPPGRKIVAQPHFEKRYAATLT
jgi:hypothetical protein